MSKRISNGGSYAMDAFYLVYDGPKSLLFSLVAAFIGLPVVAWLINWMTVNYAQLTFITADHMTAMNNFYANVPWPARIFGLGIAAFFVTPFMVFFYSGLIRYMTDIKKRFDFKGRMMAGVSGLGCFSLWFYGLIIAAAVMRMFTLSWDMMFSPAYALESSICMLICLYSCFAMVSVLVKKDGFIDASRRSFSIIFNYLPEIISGIFVWCIMSFAGFYVVRVASVFTIECIKQMANPFFSATNLMVLVYPGMWVFASMTAWVLFVYEICRTSKVK